MAGTETAAPRVVSMVKKLNITGKSFCPKCLIIRIETGTETPQLAIPIVKA